MLLTLFVDASYYHETGASAYAFWAVSERGKLTFSGRFTKKIEGSGHAELAAIANALHVVLPHPIAAGAKQVLIQSDCTGAIDRVKNKDSSRHGKLLQHILSTADKYGVSVIMRHIKAHSGTGEPRLFCHDWCDKEARRIARIIHRERGGYKKKQAKVVRYR
jgi:ribonuclease HI